MYSSSWKVYIIGACWLKVKFMNSDKIPLLGAGFRANRASRNHELAEDEPKNGALTI